MPTVFAVLTEKIPAPKGKHVMGLSRIVAFPIQGGGGGGGGARGRRGEGTTTCPCTRRQLPPLRKGAVEFQRRVHEAHVQQAYVAPREGFLTVGTEVDQRALLPQERRLLLLKGVTRE